MLVSQQSTHAPQIFTGELTLNSPTLESDGSYYETHTFAGTAGESLTFELTSDDFDAYLILLNPVGERIAQDDDGAGGTNARITLTLPVNGTYTFIVKSYEPSETGAYRFEVRASTVSEEATARAAQLELQISDLYQSGSYSSIIPLAEEVLAIFEQELGPEHPDTARSLNNLAFFYKLTGHYQEAEPLYLRALAVYEQQLGSSHPLTATSLSNLASLYSSMGGYGEAEPLYRRALEIREQQLGENHPDTASSLNGLASVYSSIGRYEEAESLHRRALEIREQQLGENHPDTATSLNNLASLYSSVGQYREAEPLYRRALEIREQQLGENHPDTAASLNNLAGSLEFMGRYKEAESLYTRALAVSEQQLGENHPDTASILNNLASIYESTSRYEEAEAFYQRSLSIYEQRLGADHPTTALGLNNLAGLYESIGRYEEAVLLYKRSLSIYEQQLGERHPDTASSLNNLAALYETINRYEEAEPLYQRARIIREQQLGANHPDTASSLNNLAGLYISMRRYGEVEPLLQQSLAIREQYLGPNHPETASSLSSLAGFYLSTGRYEEAEPLFQQALTIREQQLGADHSDTAISLNNLAGLYQSMGRYEQAELLYQRALKIWEQNEDSDYLVARGLNNLAGVYRATSRYETAASFYQQALAIREQLGVDHQDTANILSNLARLYYTQGQFQLALNNLSRGLYIEETVLSRNLLGGSDKDKREYLTTFSPRTSLAISLHLNELSSDEAAAKLAITALLQRKGRIVDLFTNLRSQFVNKPDLLALLDDLSSVSSQLATLTYLPPKDRNIATYQANLQTLQERYNDLEDELSRYSSEFSELTSSPTLEDIQSALPPNTALVEFMRYRPFDPNTERDSFGPYHYAVYLLSADGNIQGMDLGPAERIDMAVSALSISLASSNTPLSQVREDAQALERLVMAPLRETLGEQKIIFLSPDGALNLVPFEALVDESGDYLITKYQFRYLTSGRDLMRINKPFAGNNFALLIGNPTYGRPGEEVAEADSFRSIDLENLVFPALPGTQTEVNLIALQLDDVEVYTRTNATEAIIKQRSQPNILHIATHGFFKPIEDALNPLLQSGLILAGAASVGQSGPNQDGILTALEVTGMNLSGTQLVVLSACETGLGELTAGEGVYGLRRAFVLAGSQTQVISLWKVDDSATQELMVNYYDRLLSGSPRDAALRETQLALLESEEYSHPYYWAAFVGSGDWRPLQQ
ncbi:tetratricopeptide repeat protein [Halomicronema sp. CCY15110]|uniref:tetratricopeptide repeat protein n=1 Tax=Halomicronema sp. CCY15110 TaxID=2767773 RepID=UPI001950051A|nr:tetratricopeptide repeat protein [Halomicronema sp. CCY15110]